MIQTLELAKVHDPYRLQVLTDLGLLDTPAEEAFDRLTRLASKITGSPISLVTLVDADRQFFKSAFGLPEPVASARETPLSYSFCKHVVETQGALMAEDVRDDPMLNDNLAIPEFGIIGYLGMPLTTTDGVDLGSFCVLDVKPRKWTVQEIEIMRELALSVMTEIELRAQVKARTEAEESLILRNSQYKRVYHFAKSTINTMRDSINRGTDNREITVYLDQMDQQLEKL